MSSMNSSMLSQGSPSRALLTTLCMCVLLTQPIDAFSPAACSAFRTVCKSASHGQQRDVAQQRTESTRRWNAVPGCAASRTALHASSATDMENSPAAEHHSETTQQLADEEEEDEDDDDDVEEDGFDFMMMDEDPDAEEFPSPDNLDTMEVKELLLDLLPRMRGKAEEYAAVESYVNALEGRYMPVQTLDFLNMAMSGEWQLLFSTNLAGGPKPTFRLRELVQIVEPNDRDGVCNNQATWDLIVDGPDFDSSGTFTAKCAYEVTQGSRLSMELKDHVLELKTGARVPKDVSELVGFLHRAMPKEMFDPNDHSMDTTYLDGDLRIVRMTGGNFEGVRDIFIRSGSMEINPTNNSSD